MQRMNRTALSLLLVAVLLAACQAPLSAQEILTNSSTAMENVSSFTYTMYIMINSGETPSTISVNGVAEPPDHTYMTLEVSEGTVEMVMLSTEEIYVRILNLENPQDWTVVPPEQLGQLGFDLDSVLQTGNSLDYYIDPQLVGTETINGVECYHITYTIDTTEMMATLGEFYQAAEVTLDDATGEVWVGVDDSLIYKTQSNVAVTAMGIQTQEAVTINLSAFNEPVEIPDPTAQ
ncbi:MAG TPA: LppX_LprAFG lipoprotein [Longilinea sp.]|nr:LppX_LprAFG lipoprotein [Longilinea sp.]